MRSTKTETIDGVTYELHALGGIDASRALLPAMRIAPALVDAFTALAAGRFGRAAVALHAAREEDLQALITVFEASTTIVQQIQGAALGQVMRLPMKGTFDEHFRGKIGPMIKWMQAAYDLNFSDFLADMVPSQKGTTDTTPAPAAPSIVPS